MTWPGAFPNDDSVVVRASGHLVAGEPGQPGTPATLGGHGHARLHHHRADHGVKVLVRNQPPGALEAAVASGSRQ